MSDAYKCDRCGEFHEGSPERLAVRSFSKSGEFNTWLDGEHVLGVELCPDCHDEFVPTIQDFLGLDTER